MSQLLAELFSSKVRAAVLALLLPRPHLGFSLTELSRRLGLPISSLQHECYKLARLGLLRDERTGNARLYRPDPEFSLLRPLTALTLSAMPLPLALQGAAEQVKGLERCWVAGNLTSPSGPVFLIVVGQLDLEAIDGIFDRVRLALGTVIDARRLELAYYRSGDWAAKVQSGDPFVMSLLDERAVELIPLPCDVAAEVGAGV